MNCTGTINGLWWYRTTQDTGTNTATIWRNGTIIAETTTNPATTGWTLATFTTPINVTTGDKLIVGIHHPNGAYANRVNGFTNRSVVSPTGCMTAPLSQTTAKNGLYAYSQTRTLPTLSYADTEYFITPNFTRA